MDYEKAYKAVLQTATQWIKDGCTDKEKICLECVFPELRESEDERIRKGIVETIKQCPDTFLNPKNRDEMLAYLEKQEQKPEVDESTKRLNENWMKQYFDEQQEQKPAWSEEDTEMYINVASSLRGYACGLENEEHKRHIKKELDWLENRFKSLHPQPKQMPADWTDKDKRILDDVSHLLIMLNYKDMARAYKQAIEKLIKLKRL